MKVDDELKHEKYMRYSAVLCGGDILVQQNIIEDYIRSIIKTSKFVIMFYSKPIQMIACTLIKWLLECFWEVLYIMKHRIYKVLFAHGLYETILWLCIRLKTINFLLHAQGESKRRAQHIRHKTWMYSIAIHTWENVEWHEKSCKARKTVEFAILHASKCWNSNWWWLKLIVHQ